MDYRPTEQEIHEARLTAFALGELDGPGAEEAIARMETDAAFRAEVEAVRANAALLKQALREEAGSTLTSAQHEEIEHALTEEVGSAPAPLIFTKRNFWLGVGGTALAASLAAAFVLPGLFPNEPLSTDEFATGDGMRSPSMEMSDREAEGSVEFDRGLRTPGPVGGGDRAAGGEFREAMDELAASPPSGAELHLQDLSGGFGGGGGGIAGEKDADGRLMRLRESGESRRSRGRPASRPPAAGRRDFGGQSTSPTPPAAPQRPPSNTVAPPTEDRGAEAVTIEPPVDSLDDLQRDRAVSEEQVAQVVENAFIVPTGKEDSTFSIDVDTASYAFVRRTLRGGMLPEPNAVRIEEMLNYFDYDYEPPSEVDGHPFKTNVEMATAPWEPTHRLVRVGLKARDIDFENRVGTNLVFLLDVSGSMSGSDRLPLLKKSMRLLVDELTADDRVTIVTYASNVGVALPPTYCNQKQQILDAIEWLNAGGSTNGSQGIQTAYELARQNFIEGGVNRVIWATDGDLNVGVTDDEALVRLIEQERASGVLLTTLGFGTGNFKDSKLEKITNAGNGNYAYIDSVDEAKKVLVDQIGGTLFTVAKDVKIQVDFNPALVKEFRLIGYENRILAAQDFLDDTKDAGDIGAGHAVTALYEVISIEPRELARAEGQPVPLPAGGGSGGEIEAHQRTNRPANASSDWLMRLKLRYKLPDGNESTGFEEYVADSVQHWTDATEDFRFAAGVASFGMMLRHSTYAGDSSIELIRQLIASPDQDSEDSYRKEFRNLVELAAPLMESQ